MNRILIVDDDPASVAVLEAYLGDEASEIRSVSESHHVEQAFLEFEPDIVLLDLHMPKPDGLEILSNLSSMRNSIWSRHSPMEATADLRSFFHWGEIVPQRGGSFLDLRY